MSEPAHLAPEPIRLADYKPPAWLVPRLDLDIALDPGLTTVKSRLTVRANPARPDRGPLRLDGEMQRLVSVAVDGVVLAPDAYTLTATSLSLAPPSDAFTLEIVSEIIPETNTALEGLYLSGKTLTSQCEAEGFRRITYFPDRPDVLSIYRTRLSAERGRFPLLLSNGNLTERGTLDGGRHYAVWDDPFPKPCYLFALVAGDLARLEDRFVTRSGRPVTLHLYVEHGSEAKAGFAMGALKRAMAWDEEVFGLEYDLDIFQIVAVPDFNMGAMENKGLNIFNARYILADPASATDQDFANIEAVVAHEYFHNWTGNRITCRDWFQLSLKEGLTVFRDQLFQADMRGEAIKRIADVRTLRSHQFPEDAGPLAHPVRPESYVEINNFYTATVYEKGAEIVRMLYRLLGREGFARGMTLYVARHDGSAATVEDFVAAMEDSSGRDLAQFRLWYAQSGTPELKADWQRTGAGYALTLSQRTAPTPDQAQKSPLHIPIAMGLVGPKGDVLPTRLLELRTESQSFEFPDAPEGAVPSILRGFSAPCRVSREVDGATARLLMARDPDPFNRWDSGQGYALTFMLTLAKGESPEGSAEAVIDGLAEALAATLADDSLDPAFKAAMLTLPAERDIAQLMPVIDVDAIYAARASLLAGLSARLGDQLLALYHGLALNAPYEPSPAQAAQRSLRNASLRLLAARRPAPDLDLVAQHVKAATNMTDEMAGLGILADHDGPARDEAFAALYRRFAGDSLVIDKWLALQAGSDLPNIVERVAELMHHEAFTLRNPNKVRALIGTFAHNNMRGFHRAGGAGYRFVADAILALDGLNPQVAARLLTAFESWRRFDSQRAALMSTALTSIAVSPGLSPNLTELSGRLLA
jgi:aminopeptidase N